DVAVDRPAPRQQRRCEDRERGVLRSRDPDLARQADAAADDDLLQGRAPLSGRRGAFGGRRGDAGVLVAEAALGARLATGFLAADLVAVVVAHLAAAPGEVVLAAVPLGAHRLLALVGAAGRPVTGHGRRGLPLGLRGGRLVGRLVGSGLAGRFGLLDGRTLGTVLVFLRHGSGRE